MSRNPLIFSLICIFVLITFGVMAWLSLPALDQYPIHWNARGEADGFAGKTAVLGVLMIIPITQIFLTLLFWWLPAIEPLKENFEQSRSAFNIIWVATMAFITAVGVMIVLLVHEGGSQLTADPLKWMAAGIALLFIFIGNVLGKIRQNYMLGIRTPWTLSSEVSWEKTHRIGGRLFVISGLAGLFCVIFLPNQAFPITMTLVLSAVLFICVYSYFIWKKDTARKT